MPGAVIYCQCACVLLRLLANIRCATCMHYCAACNRYINEMESTEDHSRYLYTLVSASSGSAAATAPAAPAAAAYNSLGYANAASAVSLSAVSLLYHSVVFTFDLYLVCTVCCQLQCCVAVSAVVHTGCLSLTFYLTVWCMYMCITAWR
jgi:hypothetical protein